MQVDHETKIIPIDPNYEAAVKQLQADGWEVAPGFTPVAVFHLVRKQAPVAPPEFEGVKGTLEIDESRLHWYRDGKRVE